VGELVRPDADRHAASESPQLEERGVYPLPAEVRDVKGIDVMTMGGQSVRVWTPCHLQPATSRQQNPATNPLEANLLNFRTMHPQVRTVQRADLKPEFVQAQGLEYEFPVPVVVPILFEGHYYDYYPDVLSGIEDGSLWVEEAGQSDWKQRPLALAKARGLREFAAKQTPPWRAGIATERHFSPAFVVNLKDMVSAMVGAAPPEDVTRDFREIWISKKATTIGRAIEMLGRQANDGEYYSFALRVIAETYKSGHIPEDLTQHRLQLGLPMRFTAPDEPRILPFDLPSTLEGEELPPDSRALPRPLAPEDGRHPLIVIPERLPPEKRQLFLNRKEAMLALDAHESASVVARRYLVLGDDGRLYPQQGLSRTMLLALYDRWIQNDRADWVLVPYAAYTGLATRMIDEFTSEIRKHYTHTNRKSFASIRLLLFPVRDRLVAELRKDDPTATLRVPSPDAIEDYCHHVLDREFKVRQARSGEKHPAKGRSSPGSFIRTIDGPGRCLQLDGHRVDIILVVEPGLTEVHHVECLALIDVWNEAPLAAVISPVPLVSEDVSRLVMLAMTDKTQLAKSMGCAQPWDIACRPLDILIDNGSIMANFQEITSMGRVPIHVSLAPKFDAPMKGVVESWFRVIAQLASLAPGATLSSPSRRGAHDSRGEALRFEMTFAEFRQFFYRAIVDHFLHAPVNSSRLRHIQADRRPGHRYIDWKESEARLGVPQFIGPADQMKLLFMRRENPNGGDGYYEITDDGIHFNYRWYRPIEGKVQDYRPNRASVLWDRQDLTFIYPQVIRKSGLGEFLGPWYTDAFGAVPMSMAEVKAYDERSQAMYLAEEAVADGSLGQTFAELRLNKNERLEVTKNYLAIRYRNENLPMVHLEAANQVRAALFANVTVEPAPILQFPVAPRPAEPLPTNDLDDRPRQIWSNFRAPDR
jgi:hypothetical protein